MVSLAGAAGRGASFEACAFNNTWWSIAIVLIVLAYKKIHTLMTPSLVSCAATSPLFVAMFLSAPWLQSRFTMFRWFLLAAQCRAVHPLMSCCEFVFTPLEKMKVRLSHS